MAILPLVNDRHPCLRQKAEKVGEITPEIRKLVKDLIRTMYDAPGVGLAAPQVGVCRQVAVVDVGQGLIVLINPELIEAEGSEMATEGCLSLPGIAGDVRRADVVTVKARDINGNYFKMRCEGLLARAMQHEIDHLNGALFVDRADPLTLRRQEDGNR